MSSDTRNQHFGVVTGSKASEGAAAGAAAGGAIGALVLGLAAVGSIAVPGIGLLAAGPLVAALAGAGAGGASGIPEYEAKLYGTRLEQGGILVGANAHDPRQVEVARTTLLNCGGESLAAA
jgi:hypothetical protein